MARRWYLDWNATAPVRPEAAAAAAEVLRAGHGNPASVHAEGRRARAALERARGEVAALVGGAADEVVFTSGGTESNAAGIWGLLAGGGLGRRALLVSASEHPAVAAMAAEMSRLGVVVERIPVGGNGLLELDALTSAVSRHAGAVAAVQLANSETGVLQDLGAVCSLVHAAGGLVHCDAVQAVGKVALPPRRWGVDTLAVSGHKIGAPSGIGALAVRAGVTLVPLIPGTQEAHRRGGTENLPGAAGLGAACRLAAVELARWPGVSAVRDAFETALLERLPGCPVYGAGAPRLPNTSCVGLPPGLLGPVAVAALDLEGFAVSSGPACGSGVELRSPAVEAMGFGEEASERTLRVSLGLETREHEVLGLAGALELVWRRGQGGAR
ncbi:MAG TPA: aminotransferase class V-fold PLP-dependent enzyme [Thermoanaerobaculaceae bacterium]|nr:aminotransferase class V-fold PLP-dependent enzyme [Thermoanaerobaculaceae bacterium]